MSKKMSYVSDDRNYTDPHQSGVGSDIERAGDIKAEPPENKATDKETASKLANLLEGLQFPVTKEEIKNHINRKSPSMGNRTNDAFEAIMNNLKDGISYNNVYEIEVASRLVEKK